MCPIIALSGIDGSGKTTQSRLLVDSLKADGREASSFRALSPESEFLRGLLRLDARAAEDGRAVSHELRAFALALEASRRIRRTVVPADRRGEFIVCDRYTWTHFAYGSAYGVEMTWVAMLFEAVPTPHLTFVLDLPVNIALARIADRGSVHTMNENRAILTQARRALLELAATHDLVVVDGMRRRDEIHDLMRATVQERFR